MHSRTSALFESGIASRVNPQQPNRISPLLISGNASKLLNAGSVTFSPRQKLSLTIFSNRDSARSNLQSSRWCPSEAITLAKFA
jgi:hypothetical protein